jgi:hypothetical protein
MSKNAAPATAQGVTHRLAKPTTARFVRITMIKASDGQAVGLVDVEVF